MDTRLNVCVSAARPENLSKPQLRFLGALQDRIEGAGLRIVQDSAGSDKVEARLSKIRQCHGVIVVAFSQWTAQRLHREQERTTILPSEFNHVMAVMAVAARRPLLVLREKRVAERGALRAGYLDHVVNVPASLKIDWLETTDFKSEFQKWRRDVECYRHVFLGYSSRAADVANLVHKFLTEKMRLRVFDWHDFRAGDTIWDSIERAERSTTCGLFLFMSDDVVGTGNKKEFAPRDNVVYEAGYFAGAKGKSQSLIIREEGAKVPSDLGGVLFLPLTGRKDISLIETRLREQLERMLQEPA